MHLNEFELDDDLVGKRLGNFRLLSKIGEGACGVVYKAEQVFIKELYAIKILRTDKKIDPVLVERFRREARVISKLKHENIVQLVDFGMLEARAGFYLAMEFLEGNTLEDLLSSDRQFSLHQIYRIYRQLCSALDYIHKNGVIHRDLKPSNIFLLKNREEEDKIKIIDFGIASLATEDVTLTKDNATFGTPLYMSPEQAMGKLRELDGRSDLYSISVILYTLLTGQRPFSGTNFFELVFQHIQVPPPKLRDVRPDVDWSPRLEEFISRALAKSPDDRPPTGATYWKELEIALSEQIKIQNLKNSQREISIKVEPPPQGQQAGRSASTPLDSELYLPTSSYNLLEGDSEHLDRGGGGGEPIADKKSRDSSPSGKRKLLIPAIILAAAGIIVAALGLKSAGKNSAAQNTGRQERGKVSSDISNYSMASGDQPLPQPIKIREDKKSKGRRQNEEREGITELKIKVKRGDSRKNTSVKKEKRRGEKKYSQRKKRNSLKKLGDRSGSSEKRVYQKKNSRKGRAVPIDPFDIK